MYVCPSVRIFGDFYEGDMRRPDTVFPLLAFQLGFSGIPEIHEKTAKSRSVSDPVGPCFGTLFCHFFSEKVPFFPARPGEGPASRFSLYHGRLRRNPARRVNLVLFSGA